MKTLTAGVALLAVLAAACSGDDTDEGAAASEPPATTAASPTSSTTSGGGGFDPFAGPPGANPDDPVCAAAQVLIDLEERFDLEVSSDLITLLQVLEDGSAGDEAQERIDVLAASAASAADDVEAAYDRLESSVPDQLVADVETTAGFTAGFFEALAGVGDVDDFETFRDEWLVADGANAQEAADAILRVDDYTFGQCGFSITD